MRRDVVIFFLVSFSLSSLLDFLLYTKLPHMGQVETQVYAMLWGLARMYTPTLGVLFALISAGENIKFKLMSYLNIGKRALKFFLTAPLFVYLALCVFFILTSVLNMLDFERFFELMVSSSGLVTKEFAVMLFFINLILSYPISLTLNSLFALGEELGWRGYLFEALGGKYDLRNVLIVGIIWALWHSTAIVLLGHNYPSVRAGGIPLFILFCIALSLPMLKLTRDSGSVLPAVSLYGCLNAVWGLTVHTTKMGGIENEIHGGMGDLWDPITDLSFRFNVHTHGKRS